MEEKGPVVDENWSFVECSNLERAESDVGNIFRSYGERKRKCSGEDQNCKGRDSRKKYCVVQILLGAAR